jgi:hypothetical protein
VNNPTELTDEQRTLLGIAFVDQGVLVTGKIYHIAVAELVRRGLMARREQTNFYSITTEGKKIYTREAQPLDEETVIISIPLD